MSKSSRSGATGASDRRPSTPSQAVLPGLLPEPFGRVSQPPEPAPIAAGPVLGVAKLLPQEPGLRDGSSTIEAIYRVEFLGQVVAEVAQHRDLEPNDEGAVCVWPACDCPAYRDGWNCEHIHLLEQLGLVETEVLAAPWLALEEVA